MIKNAIAYITRKRNRTLIIFIILTIVLSCLYSCLTIMKSSNEIEKTLYESSNSSISITKKDGKYFNVNYMLANGIYKTGKTGLNLPFEGYWIIITFNTSNNLGNSSTAWITQFAISTDWSDKAIYFRRNINYTPTTWESWNRLVAS